MIRTKDKHIEKRDEQESPLSETFRRMERERHLRLLYMNDNINTYKDEDKKK